MPTTASATVRAGLSRQLDGVPDYVLRRTKLMASLHRGLHITRAGRRLRATVRDIDQLEHVVDVWVDARGRVVETVCTCWTGSGCAHSVRVMEAWRDGVAAESGGEELDTLAQMTPGALLEWANVRGARTLLDRPATPLLKRYGQIGSRRGLPRGATVQDVLCGPSSDDGWTTGLRHRLAEALRGAVQELQDAEAHAEHAETWRSQPPEDSGLRRLWSAVRAAREGRDALAPPMLLPTTNSGRLRVTTDPPGVDWVSTARSSCRHGDTARMRLAWHDTRGLCATCACPSGPDAACSTYTDFLDRTLDLLTEERHRTPRGRLQAALATPTWSRDLAALDGVLGRLGASGTDPQESAPDDKERRPGWRLSPAAQGGWGLELVWTRPYAQRAGLRTWKWDGAARGERSTHLSAPDHAAVHAMGALSSGGHLGAEEAALAALVGHPRLVLPSGNTVELVEARLTLAWTPTDDGGVALSPMLDGRGVPPGSVVLEELATLDPRCALLDVDEARGTATLVHASSAARELVAGILQRGGRFPASALDALWSRQPALAAVLPQSIAPALRGVEVAADLQPVVRLTVSADGSLDVVVGTRPLPTSLVLTPGDGPDEVFSHQGGARQFVVRDRGMEQQALEAELVELLGDGVRAPWRVRMADPDAVLDLVASLQRASEAGQVCVEWSGRPPKVVGTAIPEDLHLRVGSGQDWLALGGELSGQGWSVDVAEAMEALRTGRKYIRVDELGWVRLTDTLRSCLEALAARTMQDSRGQDQLMPLSAPVLEAMAAAGADVEVPAELALQQQRIDEAEQWPPAVPEGLQATLRPYQADGVQWLRQRAHWSPGAVLADDMGLGKTLQALALLLERAEQGPALVVAPTSVGFNWLAEAARFAPGLNVHSWRGKGRQEMLSTVGPGDVLVTSWDLLARDAKALAAVHFSTVVLDEAQAIKNPETRRHRAARALDRDFTLALTGTPVENRTEDLWALFAAVVPGLLGPRAWFRRAFGRESDAGVGDARATLGELVRPFVLRRTKKAVAPELPARTEQVLRVELSTGERRLYDATRQATLLAMEEDDDDNRIKMLAALTRLRQLACHPRLAQPSSRVRSSKAKALVEVVDGFVASGQRVLVFSQFTRHLDLAAEALSHHRQLRLQGDTPARTRARRVRAFQSGEADVFLISLKAGGTGLNLTAATAVVHLDPWWNPAAEDQATDRAHRIGQDQPVTVVRLVASNTVEDGILAMQSDKRKLVEGLMAGTSAGGPPDLAALRALLAG